MEKTLIPPALNTCSASAPLSQHPPDPVRCPSPATEGPSTDLEARSQCLHQPATPGLRTPPSRAALCTSALPKRLWGRRAEEHLGTLPPPASRSSPRGTTPGPGSRRLAAVVCPTAPARLPRPHHPGVGRGQRSDHWRLGAHSSPQMGNSKSRSGINSETASHHQSFKADLGRSGEKESGGCRKIVPSLPPPRHSPMAQSGLLGCCWASGLRSGSPGSALKIQDPGLSSAY